MNIYDEQYKKLGFNAQRLYPNEELLRFMGRRFFSIPKNKRRKIKILELGCGSGANLWMIAKEGFKCYGIDISKEGLKLCLRMLRKYRVKAQVLVGDMRKLPYINDFFDAVIDIVSLQHLLFSEHILVYREIKRVLKPEGVFFFLSFGK